METATIDQLKIECEELWSKLQLAQRSVTGSVTPDHQNPYHDILKHKEKLLQANIEEAKDANISERADENIQYETLKSDLQGAVTQLQGALLHEEAVWSEIQTEHDEQQRIHAENLEIRSALQRKLEDVNNQQVETDPKTFLANTEKKNLNAEKHLKCLMKEMASFLHQHFPTPKDEVKGKRKRHNSGPTNSMNLSGEVGAEHYVSLQNMLEELMNKCMETPHDPYIQLQYNHWPPFVELLKRVGIAHSKPEDDRLLKLTPFHS